MSDSVSNAFAQTGSPVNRYRALLEVARSFSRAVDLRALIDQTLLQAEEVMHAEACSLLLPDPRTGELIIHSTDEWIIKLPEPLRVPPGAGIAGAVFRSKKLLNIKDVRSDPRHYASFSTRLGRVTRSMVSVPLLDGDHCLGVLQVINPCGRDFFDTEDEEIAEAFGGLIVNALVRLESQHREVERAEARQQLLLAREIQEAFLPPAVSRFPYCQVLHSHLPAQMVGGDFGIVQRVGPTRLLLGLGDVCGKGIPAALTVARATAIIEAITCQVHDDLGEWVTRLNALLARELKAGRFISMVLILADVVEGALQICTAGQFPPAQFDGRRWKLFEIPNQFPLGFSPVTAYTASRLELRPGDQWMLFTDGVSEARDAAGREYTTECFLTSLPVGKTGEETLRAACRAWEEYRNGAVQHDDATLLLLNWRGQQPASELRTLCSPEKLAEIRRLVEQWAHFAGFGDIEAGQIVMACDEACTNVFRHSYQEQPGPVQVNFDLTETALNVQLTDEAPPVQTGKIQGRDLADLRPGGLGTVVISNVFDEVKYTAEKAGNCLMLRKLLPGKGV